MERVRKALESLGTNPVAYKAPNGTITLYSSYITLDKAGALVPNGPLLQPGGTLVEFSVAASVSAPDRTRRPSNLDLGPETYAHVSDGAGVYSVLLRDTLNLSPFVTKSGSAYYPVGATQGFIQRSWAFGSVLVSRAHTQSFRRQDDARTALKLQQEMSAAAVQPAREWLTTLYRALERHGVFSDGPQPSAGAELLDANPDFTSAAITDPAAPAADAIAGGVGNKKRRIGAAADGLSLLLIRKRVDEPGRATLKVVEDRAGYLEPLQHPWTASSTSLTVEAVAVDPARTERWILALYQPPNEFALRGTRQVSIRIEFKPASGGVVSTEDLELKLIRPPVLLVHGTYDDPKNCWETPGKEIGNPFSMATRIRSEAIRVFQVDFKSTNGAQDPSDFVTNEKTVWQNPGGLKDTLNAVRGEGFAVTQADLVCHSQGGVLARVYARGRRLTEPFGSNEPHFGPPGSCGTAGKPACWYHRAENFHRGDIRRLITLCTTHSGSDICRIFTAYKAVCDMRKVDVVVQYGAALFNWFALRSNGGFTGGFNDQIPYSKALKAIGPTRIPSHAIACVARDADLSTPDDTGFTYQSRIERLWEGSDKSLIREAYKWLGQHEDAEALFRLKELEEKAYQQFSRDAYHAVVSRSAQRMRAAAFGNAPNDCTVRRESALGGLPTEYTTTLTGVLHGSAPRYPGVQQRVLDLLKNDGSLFCPAGFPSSGYPMPNVRWDGNAHTGGSSTTQQFDLGSGPAARPLTKPSSKAPGTSVPPIPLPIPPSDPTRIKEVFESWSPDRMEPAGIGAVIERRNGEWVVTGISAAGSLGRAKDAVGWKLTEIDGIPLKHLSPEQVRDLIVGVKGQKVSWTFFKPATRTEQVLVKIRR